MYWFYYDHSEERRAMAKEAVDSAFRLDPDLAEAHVALGRYYYYCLLDFDQAVEQFNIARKSQPSNSELLFFIAAVQRRQGKFEQALTNVKRAAELDPLSGNLHLQAAVTFMLLHDYPEAERYYDRAISLSPDRAFTYFWKAGLYLQWQGDIGKARAVLEEALENVKSEDNADIVNSLVSMDVYDGKYQEALDRLSLRTEYIDNQFDFIPKALQCAQICDRMKKNDLAKKYYDDAQSILETKIQQSPEDAQPHSSLGIAYAGLGRKEDAIREGRLAVKMLPVSKDAWRGLYRVRDLARIYVMVGEFDAAIEQLKFLLSVPGEVTIPLLRIEPTWAPLRDHPGFKELLEEGK
jgi:tetratricopeptide (TPR) repeat protein